MTDDGLESRLTKVEVKVDSMMALCAELPDLTQRLVRLETKMNILAFIGATTTSSIVALIIILVSGVWR